MAGHFRRKTGLFAEAFFLQLFFRVILTVFPWRTCRRYFLGPNVLREGETAPGGCSQELDDIAWAVKRSTRYVPWKKTCLTAAITARTMLQARGLPAILYFGVRKESEKELSSHAWLKCGETPIVGGTGEGYILISRFM